MKIEFGPRGRYLYAGTNDGLVQWDWKNGIRANEFDTSYRFGRAFALSPDGRYLVAPAGSSGDKLRVYQIPD